MTADQNLLAAEAAQEKAGAGVIEELALALGASVTPWTRSAPGAIMPLQSCSGTVWGAAPNLNCQVHRSAPRLVQRSTATVALTK